MTFGPRMVTQAEMDKFAADVTNDAIEAAAKIAEGKMHCGCGRADCYSDRIPEAIAADIRKLKS